MDDLNALDYIDVEERTLHAVQHHLVERLCKLSVINYCIRLSGQNCSDTHATVAINPWQPKEDRDAALLFSFSKETSPLEPLGTWAAEDVSSL